MSCRGRLEGETARAVGEDKGAGRIGSDGPVDGVVGRAKGEKGGKGKRRELVGMAGYEGAGK